MAARWQELLCLGLRLTGIPRLMREVYARHKVTIVNYHDPCPETFARHIEFFDRVYSFIGIDRLAQALEASDFSDLPPKPMLVTFDDGHIGNAQLFGTIRKHRVPALVYAVAGVVDTRRGFWFDQLPHGGTEMTRLKALPDRERREAVEAEYGHTDHREYATAAALSAEQLREFIALGGTVGSHTVFHPLLNRCEEAVGRDECTKSRKILEEMLGQTVRHFALPNGNGDERTRAWLTDAGYATCRTTKAGWVNPDSDPLGLRNFGIADSAGVHKAAIQACGLWDLLKRFLSCARGRER